MTEERAIEILNPDADVVWKAYDGKDMERCNEACRVACVALAKQIPIKPDYEGDGYDENRCIIKFEDCYSKEKALIEWIKANKIKILNSGIKIA